MTFQYKVWEIKPLCLILPFQASQTTERLRPYTRVTVLGQSFKALVDTGALINVLDEGTFDKLCEIALKKTKIQDVAYDRENQAGNLISGETAQELGLVTFHLSKVSTRYVKSVALYKLRGLQCQILSKKWVDATKSGTIQDLWKNVIKDFSDNTLKKSFTYPGGKIEEKVDGKNF
eukprot:gene2347-2702_t